MKTLLVSIALILSVISFSQTEEENLTPHTIIQNDVTLTLYLNTNQKIVESDSGYVVYGNKFIMQVSVSGSVPAKLFVSGAGCQISLISKEEAKYKFSTTTWVGKRKLSINYGSKPEMIELWIHPDLN